VPTKTKQKSNLLQIILQNPEEARTAYRKVKKKQLSKNELENLFKNEKAKTAWDYLQDRSTKQLVFGGGAGGGKSTLGVNWLIDCCLKYPETRWLMGRAVLKTLKESTLQTFFDTCKRRGLERDVDFKYNAIDGVITFIETKSTIYLKDLAYKPSDPNYDELGSTEFTGGFIDECNQIEKKCWNIVITRIRYKLSEYDLSPKLLGTCNPAKNWVYSDFYKPDKDGELIEYRKFITALATDNPYCDPQYIENLKNGDEFTRERLLYGNWEYDNDDSKLYKYDQIQDLFTNSFVEKTGEKYISADIALQGSDLLVIGVWDGLVLEKIVYKEKSEGSEIETLLKELAEQNQVPRSHIIYDNDGVGGYLSSYMKGIKSFVNGSQPLNKENYINLKAQCYFKLQEIIDKIWIKDSSVNTKTVNKKTIKENIIEELEQIKRKDADNDGKLAIIPKSKIKENIGRSPDFSDMIMMRMFFEIKVARKGIRKRVTVKNH